MQKFRGKTPLPRRRRRYFTIVWPCIVTDSLWIKPTDALNSNFIGITTLHVSGSLFASHQEFLAVHQLWHILCSCDELFATRIRMVVNGSSQLHKAYQSRCTAKNSWWLLERLPETCRVVIPIKLEFSAFVGFIHKEGVSFFRKVSFCHLYYKASHTWRQLS